MSFFWRKSIPGFTFREGTYHPNEPWQEGQPRITGLQQAFPKLKSVDGNPLTPAKISLGKFLYFDPILSASLKPSLDSGGRNGNYNR